MSETEQRTVVALHDFSERIPVAGPWVTELEAEFVADAALNDWYGNAGRSVGLFETEFAAHLGARHALAVPHATSALHLAMVALDLGPGDEVIVPETTFVATAAPITYTGATPVFADIDPDTWCMSADSLKQCLSPRTKAIVTVDLYGDVPDMSAIRELAGDIPVIEDAAQAIGAIRHGIPAGMLGDMGVFSFHGTKTLTSGEGGIVVTDRTDLFETMAQLRNLGRRPGAHAQLVSDIPGFKYQMSSLQAAFGRAQLLRVDELVAKKRRLFGWYRDRLADLDGVQLNAQGAGHLNPYWMTNIVVDKSFGVSTRQMMAYFDDNGVDTRPFFPPLSSLQAFSNYPDQVATARAANSVAYDIAQRSINLPSALMLEEEHIDRVVGLLRSFLHTEKDNR